MNKVQILASVVLLTGALGCSRAKTHAPQGAAPVAESEVGTILIEETEAPVFFEATGDLKARLNATLASKIMARVGEVSAREGDEIAKGQLLVRLDARELASSVDIAQANLAASRVGVDSATTSRVMERESSAARIAQAEAGVAQAKAAVAGAKSELDLVLAGPREQEKLQAHLLVVQAEATLNRAKIELDRVTNLVNLGALARKELDNAKTAYDVALAQRDVAVQSEKIAIEGSRRQDVQTARERVTQAEAAQRHAEANLKEAKAAALQVQVREEQIKAAKAQVSQSAAALDAARVALDYATVSAPFSGRVVARHVDPGSLTTPGAPLLTIEGGELRLEATVPEGVLSHATRGAQIPLQVDAIGQTISGRVDEIVPRGDPASHTFLVKISLPQSSGAKSGMFGRAKFQTGSEKRIEIPAAATWEREGMRYVFAINEEGIARLRIVTLGKQIDGKVVVLSGLKPGDRIVADGRESVTDGMRVVSR